MGFLDKVKETAAKAGEGVKKGTASVKDKVEDAQTRKKADELAKQLGYLVVRERSEGTPAGTDADRLVSEIVALQRQLEDEGSGAAEVPAQPQAESAPQMQETQAPPTSASEPAPGDFKLD